MGITELQCMEFVKKCPKCGLTLPIGSFGFKNTEKGTRQCYCKDCCSKMSSAYKEAHKEQVDAWVKRRNAEHHDELLCKSREYYAGHREEIRARARERYWANPEEERRKAREWQSKESARESRKEWMAKNPDKLRQYDKKYRDAHIDEVHARARDLREKWKEEHPEEYAASLHPRKLLTEEEKRQHELEYERKYRDAHREQINAQARAY